jgi:hypothetical protein
MYCLHLQGQRISQASKKQAVAFLLLGLFFETPMMETACSSKMVVNYLLDYTVPHPRRWLWFRVTAIKTSNPT